MILKFLLRFTLRSYDRFSIESVIRFTAEFHTPKVPWAGASWTTIQSFFGSFTVGGRNEDEPLYNAIARWGGFTIQWSRTTLPQVACPEDLMVSIATPVKIQSFTASMPETFSPELTLISESFSNEM